MNLTQNQNLTLTEKQQKNLNKLLDLAEFLDIKINNNIIQLDFKKSTALTVNGTLLLVSDNNVQLANLIELNPIYEIDNIPEEFKSIEKVKKLK